MTGEIYFSHRFKSKVYSKWRKEFTIPVKYTSEIIVLINVTDKGNNTCIMILPK